MELVADSRGEFAYWLPDQAAVENNGVMRMDLATLEATQIGGAIPGVGWYGVRLAEPDGTVLLTTQSTDSGSVFRGNDEFVRIIAIDPDGAGWQQVKIFHRGLTAAQMASVDFDAVMSLGNSVICRVRTSESATNEGVQPFGDGDIAGAIVMSPNAPFYRENVITTDIESLAVDTDLDDAGNPWFDNNASFMVKGSATLTMPGGFTRVIQGSPQTGVDTCEMTFRLSDAEREFAKGRWNTFGVLFMMPVGSHADLNPELSVEIRLDIDKNGTGEVTNVTTTRFPSYWHADGLWHEWSVRIFVPEDDIDGTELCDRIDLIVYPHNESGTNIAAGQIVYWTDQRFAPGCNQVVAGLQADGSY